MEATSKPTTYNEAAKVAEPVTLTELSELIKADDNGDIFPGPRKARRIMMDARLRTGSNWAYVGFDYCNRNGYTEVGTASLGPSYDIKTHSRTVGPIINFDSLGRIVYLAK